MSVPVALKSIQPFIRIANEHTERDPVIYYWALMQAVQLGMPHQNASPEARVFLGQLLGTLEQVKRTLAEEEAVRNEIVASAHIENYAMRLFTWADDQERTGRGDKAVMKAFYTSSYLLEMLSLFGELADHNASCAKYGKWKSTQVFESIRSGQPYTGHLSQANEDEPPRPNPVGFSAPPPSAPDDLTAQLLSIGGGGPSAAAAAPPPIYDAPPPGDVPRAASRQPPPPAQVPAPKPAKPAAPPAYNAPPPPQRNTGKPSTEQFVQAHKHAKYALSALDHEDDVAAKDYLRKALAALGE